jgi:hypothetical protein
MAIQGTFREAQEEEPLVQGGGGARPGVQICPKRAALTEHAKIVAILRADRRLYGVASCWSCGFWSKCAKSSVYYKHHGLTCS